MSKDFLDLLRLRRTSPTTFSSLTLTERMGNTFPIAYGGCALALAVQAAYHSLPDTRMALYSILGHYLGPTATDRHIKITVEDVRTTRTFATRRVVLTQVQDDGTERSSLACTLDFMATSPTSVLTYHILAPSVTHHSNLAPFDEAVESRVAAKLIHPRAASTFKTVFGLMFKMLEMKIPEDAPLGQNLWGIDKHLATSQDGVPLTDKRSASWMRSKIDLSSPPPPFDGALPISAQSASASLVAFALDGALSFIPLSLSNLFLHDAGACSSLDFALRFHTDTLDMNKWHMEEMRTIAGDFGRTFSEGLLWSEDGKLVATMSQQSVLRPKL